MTYPNLSAEMARRNVSPKDIADVLGIYVTGVYRMLSGKQEVSIYRAFLIRDNLFPDMKIDYLFAQAS